MAEIVGDYKKKVTFTVAQARLNQDGKWEYQLKNSEGELHRGGRWFPETEVKTA
jgi:hypothetical protein